jgi:hypothetical protein
VSALQRYLAEEIATDHVDGLLTRRPPSADPAVGNRGADHDFAAYLAT